jgi:hypothetical protein
MRNLAMAICTLEQYQSTVVRKLIGTSIYFGKHQVLLVADTQTRVVYLGFL